MNNKEKELYDKLLSEKQLIENNFKINSEYNRTQKGMGNILWDPTGLMDISNDAATIFNNKVKSLLPQEYKTLFIQYRFFY